MANSKHRCSQGECASRTLSVSRSPVLWCTTCISPRKVTDGSHSSEWAALYGPFDVRKWSFLEEPDCITRALSKHGVFSGWRTRASQRFRALGGGVPTPRGQLGGGGTISREHGFPITARKKVGPWSYDHKEVNSASNWARKWILPQSLERRTQPS